MSVELNVVVVDVEVVVPTVVDVDVEIVEKELLTIGTVPVLTRSPYKNLIREGDRKAPSLFTLDSKLKVEVDVLLAVDADVEVDALAADIPFTAVA